MNEKLLPGGRETLDKLGKLIEEDGGSNVQNGDLTRTYMYKGIAVGLRLLPDSGMVRLTTSEDEPIENTGYRFTDN